ncbi:hypothetical protein D3C71_2132920 [compost metagenome]
MIQMMIQVQVRVQMVQRAKLAVQDLRVPQAKLALQVQRAKLVLRVGQVQMVNRF